MKDCDTSEEKGPSRGDDSRAMRRRRAADRQQRRPDGQVSHLPGTQAQLQSLFDLSLDMVCIADINEATFVKVNPAFESTLGYKPADLLGRPFFEFIHPDDVEITQAALAEKLKKGQSVTNFENRYRCKDGTYRWLCWTSHPRPEHGLTYAVAHDITERKRDEEALRESEQRYRTLFEAANDAIFIIQDGKFVDCNSKMLDMFRCSRDQILDRRPEDVSPPRQVDGRASQAAAAEYIAAALAGAPQRFEWRHKRSDDTVFDVEVCLNALSLPTGRHVQAIVRDVTLRKAAEEAIRLERDRAQKYLDTASVMFVVLDSQGCVTTINKRGCEVLECPEQEIVGRNWFDGFLPPEVRHDVHAVFGQLMRGELEPQEYVENLVLTRSGKERIVAWHNALLRDEAGEILGTLSSGQDITDRKRVEDALRQSEARYRSLIANIPDVVWTCDAEGKTTFMSPNIEKVCGYRPDQICRQPGNPWFQRVHPDDLPRVKQAELKLFRDGKPLDVKYRFQRKDGRWIWLQDRSTGTYELDGVRYADGVFVDVTERQRLEQALERRIVALTRPLDDAQGVEFEELFDLDEIQKLQDLFAEATGVASIITRPNGTPITRPSHFCRLCEEIIRKTPEGLKNCYYSDSVIGRHRSDGPTVQPCLSSGLWDAGASITVGGKHVANWLIGQVRNEAQDETALAAYAHQIGADVENFMSAYHEVRTMPEGQFGSIARALFVIADQLSTTAYQNVQQARFITKRKEMEAALRRSEAEFRTIFESSPCAIVFSDLDGRILACNRQFADLHATREGPKAQVGRNVSAFFSESERAALLEKLKDPDRDRLPGKPMECIMVREDGSEFPAEITSTLVMGPNGSDRALVTIAYDITERKKAERERLDYEAKLRSLASDLALAEERERRRIAADLHDHACQSLALSKMKVQSLLKTSDPVHVEALQSICEMLNETIENVRELTFDLSSPTLYKIGLEAALEELLRDRLKGEHNIMYRFSDDGRRKPLSQDVLVLLFQCVRELLINVIKHAHAREVTLDIARNDRFITVAVSDDGVGFDVDEIWLPRPDRRSVGLFNIRERLDHIGGRLDIDSQPSRGSRLTLVAPLKTEVHVAKESDYGTENSTG